VKRQAGEIADKLERMAWRLIGMFPIAAKKARDRGNISGLAVAVGVSLDKAQLLKGLPTSIGSKLGNIDLTKLSTEELEVWQALMAKARGEGGGPDPGGPRLADSA
jgi:hypothetical protein